MSMKGERLRVKLQLAVQSNVKGVLLLLFAFYSIVFDLRTKQLSLERGVQILEFGLDKFEK